MASRDSRNWADFEGGLERIVGIVCFSLYSFVPLSLAVEFYVSEVLLSLIKRAFDSDSLLTAGGGTWNTLV